MSDILAQFAVALIAGTYTAILTCYLLNRRPKTNSIVAETSFGEDAMTGVFSYDAIEEILRSRQERARKGKEKSDPISLILLDVDSFKRINEEFGMQGGDTLIKDLAKLLRTNIRGADDALFRYKLGDEFLILCFGATGLVASSRIAERLSQLIKEHNFYISTTSEARHITVSMGVTEVQIDDSFDLITRRLQQALWQAKNSKGSIHLI